MSSPKDLSRRDLFALFRRSIRPAEPPVPPVPAPVLPALLRPPGAADERTLSQTCLRCGACADACPRQAIKPLQPGPYGTALQGTPYIIPREAPCVVCTGLQCTQVCPSGALRPLLSPAEVQMGLAVVDPSRCLPFLGTACEICVDKCPVPGAITVDTEGRPHITRSCIGCGLCEHYCPTEPVAVQVRPNAAAGWR